MASDNVKAVASDALFGVWIPTSDRIPPEGENVLCWCDDGLIRLMWVVQFQTFYMWECGGDLLLCENEVTHWIPLPNPPNPRGDGAADEQTKKEQ